MCVCHVYASANSLKCVSLLNVRKGLATKTEIARLALVARAGLCLGMWGAHAGLQLVLRQPAYSMACHTAANWRDPLVAPGGGREEPGTDRAV